MSNSGQSNRDITSGDLDFDSSEVIRVTNVSHSFWDPRSRTTTAVLDKLTFAVQKGEFVCMIGPSGCGKTTMLNMIAGFIKPTSGSIVCEGMPIEAPGPDRAMVFQEYALFPWLTVSANIEFGPLMAKVSKGKRHEIAKKYIDLTGLSGFENKYPREISGGMKQRVGLARALAVDPKMMLLDEPFGALDAQTRRVMQRELSRIIEQTGKTVFFITHSIEEAIFLGDRIILLSARPGRILMNEKVNLPRPRSKEDDGYSELYTRIDDIITREVNQSLEQESVSEK